MSLGTLYCRFLSHPPRSEGDALRTSRKDHSKDSRAELWGETNATKHQHTTVHGHGSGPWTLFKLVAPSDSLVCADSNVPIVSDMHRTAPLASVGRNCDGRAFVGRMRTTRTDFANFWIAQHSKLAHWHIAQLQTLSGNASQRKLLWCTAQRLWRLSAGSAMLGPLKATRPATSTDMANF